MALRLYFDHNVRRPVCDGLRLRGVDILTAFEDGSHELQDPALLDRATFLGRVLFSQDEDLLAEGDCIDQLELVAKASDPEDLRGRVLFLPLR